LGNPKGAKKIMTILITRHDKIGDFITALPMAKVLKEQTDAKVIFLVSKVNVELAKSMDFIDDVIEYTDDSFQLLARINKHKPDVSISGYIDNHLGLCLFLARVPTRIAPSTKIAQIFFNSKIKQRRSKVEKTEWAYNLDLLHKFDESLKLEFSRPLLDLNLQREELIVFHAGFGGSSDGNLSLDDYINLARVASKKTKVVFSFGPDDIVLKEYMESYLDFEATIRDDFKSLLDFTRFIATSKLFVSTSTGPMHLAGLTNTPTLSFFGNNLFASSKRWATISEPKYQNNYEVPDNYDKEFYQQVENKMLELI
jgi:ADP-heptose:LPS heptosyltransferase